jgi:ribokinase
VVTVGEVVLDDLVVAGGPCRRQLGGGALYSAIGALAWGAEPQVNAVIGGDVPADEFRELEAAGIDFGGLGQRDGPSLGLWLLHESSGRRHQVEHEDGPRMADIDRERPAWPPPRPDGVHVAPQTSTGQLAALDRCRAEALPVTLDCMVEPYIDLAPYRDGRLLAGLSAFLPSREEVDLIWGPMATPTLAALLRELAGLSCLVVTNGAGGAVVATPDAIVRVPAVRTEVVDPTGAGDAFAGGFLVGFIETGDPIAAAARGAASAAFVVETAGPVEAVTRLDRRLADRRADEVLGSVEREEVAT